MAYGEALHRTGIDGRAQRHTPKSMNVYCRSKVWNFFTISRSAGGTRDQSIDAWRRLLLDKAIK